MRERKSLSQMAAEAGGGVSGYACPRCGCKDWRGEDGSFVESTRHPKGEQYSRRKRICRNCGQASFTTFEVIVPEGHKLSVVKDDDEDEERAA